MALQSLRDEAQNGAAVNIDYFMNVTGEAGSIVKFITATSGVGGFLDSSDALVALPTVLNGSGEVPAGLLLCDVVNKDLSQTHTNAHKREVNIGGKVGIGRKGVWVTNRIAAGDNPTPGAPAYFTAGGIVQTTSTNSTRVGTFLGSRDSNGYVKVAIDL